MSGQRTFRDECIAHTLMLLFTIGIPLALVVCIHAPKELAILVCLPGILSETLSVASDLHMLFLRR
jgi:hypothetical protein